MKKYYVYVLFRTNGSPLYVGKGTGRRWRVHEQRARREHVSHLSNIIRLAGGTIPKIKVRENLSEAEALTIEIALIAAIGREKDNGSLINQTAGGDGIRDIAPDLRDKISRTFRKNFASNPDISLNMSASAKKRAARPEERELRRQWALGNQNQLGLKRSEECLRKMSISRRKLYEDPEYRARVGRSHLGIKHTPETCAKISATMKGVPKSPETRARMKIAQQLRAEQMRQTKW